MIVKWGCDGSSGQSNYKQIADFDDSSIFMSSMVPIRIHSKNQPEKIIW